LTLDEKLQELKNREDYPNIIKQMKKALRPQEFNENKK